MSAPHEWNAHAYQRLSEPQLAWGLRVLDRLALEGGETVVDAGCGSGRLTRKLAEQLPRGRVIAVDRSTNMVEEAQRQLGDLGDRVRFVTADLATFVAEPAANAVFSTATFHWIPDHARLFASVHRSLVPGGRLVAQCGGAGNLARFHAIVEDVYRSPAFSASFDAFDPGWTFAPPDLTAARLEAAGFVDVECALEDAPTPFADAATFRAFVENVVLRTYLARLESTAHGAFLDAVMERVVGAGSLALDYVRLNIGARRG